jgi:hypothetical protein
LEPGIPGSPGELPAVQDGRTASGGDRKPFPLMLVNNQRAARLATDCPGDGEEGREEEGGEEEGEEEEGGKEEGGEEDCANGD